jgi:hypothetical protein
VVFSYFSKWNTKSHYSLGTVLTSFDFFYGRTVTRLPKEVSRSQEADPIDNLGKGTKHEMSTSIS